MGYNDNQNNIRNSYIHNPLRDSSIRVLDFKQINADAEPPSENIQKVNITEVASSLEEHKMGEKGASVSEL